MALFYECMLKCARKVLDTADIVRDAMLQQPNEPATPARAGQRQRHHSRKLFIRYKLHQFAAEQADQAEHSRAQQLDIVGPWSSWSY